MDLFESQKIDEETLGYWVSKGIDIPGGAASRERRNEKKLAHEQAKAKKAESAKSTPTTTDKKQIRPNQSQTQTQTPLPVNTSQPPSSAPISQNKPKPTSHPQQQQQQQAQQTQANSSPSSYTPPVSNPTKEIQPQPSQSSKKPQQQPQQSSSNPPTQSPGPAKNTSVSTESKTTANSTTNPPVRRRFALKPGFTITSAQFQKLWQELPMCGKLPYALNINKFPKDIPASKALEQTLKTISLSVVASGIVNKVAKLYLYGQQEGTQQVFLLEVLANIESGKCGLSVKVFVPPGKALNKSDIQQFAAMLKTTLAVFAAQ